MVALTRYDPWEDKIHVSKDDKSGFYHEYRHKLQCKNKIIRLMFTWGFLLMLFFDILFYKSIPALLLSVIIYRDFLVRLRLIKKQHDTHRLTLIKNYGLLFVIVIDSFVYHSMFAILIGVLYFILDIDAEFYSFVKRRVK